MSRDFDVCVIGSGAGGGPVALELAKAGYSVAVLEKGPWFKEEEYYKDEIACCRRSTYTPNLKQEFHVIEQQNGSGDWEAESTYDSGWDFWNGNVVGGSSNFMSGFFHRLKPEDFRLLSEFGPIEGANIADWPISYSDLEPYYEKVERAVGISGKVVDHPFLEPRSTPDFPYPPTSEHPVAKWIDRASTENGLKVLPAARAILSSPAMDRNSCAYSGYCGSYGCATGAKGSSRAALLDPAVRTGRCTVIPHAKVFKIKTGSSGKITSVAYYDKKGRTRHLDARIYVVACQAIESSRLLLASTGPAHPNGLSNRNGQVGRNLVFSAGGSGGGTFTFDKLPSKQAAELKVVGPFVNRALQDWYFIDSKKLGQRVKGGTIEFLFQHPNAIVRANRMKRKNGNLLWGPELKRQIHDQFAGTRRLRFEVFNDWLPTDNCFVELDRENHDRWNSPVAKVRVGYHSHDLTIGRFLTSKGEALLNAMGANEVSSSVSGSPPPNLVAGSCRFGQNPEKSVLDSACRSHEIENLFVSDGSFMPTGGSVPFTWTIYANAFRIADRIIAQLGGGKKISSNGEINSDPARSV